MKPYKNRKHNLAGLRQIQLLNIHWGPNTHTNDTEDDKLIRTLKVQISESVRRGESGQITNNKVINKFTTY